MGFGLPLWAFALPVITLSPVGPFAPGSAVTFTAAASGAVGYQWYRNGGAIPGATAGALTIPRIYALDAGYYTVAVTGGLDAGTSPEALLKLADLPIATTAQPELSLGAASDGTNFLVGIQGDATGPTAVTAQVVSPSGT